MELRKKGGSEMESTKLPTKRKLSWLDILFSSLSVVIPVLLSNLAEVINNPSVEIETEELNPLDSLNKENL